MKWYYPMIVMGLLLVPLLSANAQMLEEQQQATPGEAQTATGMTMPQPVVPEAVAPPSQLQSQDVQPPPPAQAMTPSAPLAPVDAPPAVNTDNRQPAIASPQPEVMPPTINTDTATTPAMAVDTAPAPQIPPQMPVVASPPASAADLQALPSPALPASSSVSDDAALPSLPNDGSQPSIITDGTSESVSPSLFTAPTSDALSSPAPGQTLPHDLSPYGMFMQADWVVKAAMIILAAASILTWIIWLAKSVEIAMAKSKAKRALKLMVDARSLAEAIEIMNNKKGVSSRLIVAAADEVRVSLSAVDGAGSDGLKERISSHLHRIEVRAGRVMSRGTGILATIGAVAPFVGLFGTVWGIMNAFIGISHAQTTNLAVVAPGIAEALLATAIGLVAAIPAVVIFNMFARSITVYRQILADVSAAIERLVSRDLDFRLAHKRAGKPTLTSASAAE